MRESKLDVESFLPKPTPEFHAHFVGSSPTDYPNYQRTPQLWKREELEKQFADELEKQLKEYDPESEWRLGWVGFPNAVGNVKMCITFDKSYKTPRGDDLHQIDPHPKPWVVAFRDKDGKRVSLPNSYGRKNFFENLWEARMAFVLTYREIRMLYEVMGVTEEDKRFAFCDNCETLFPFDYENQNYGTLSHGEEIEWTPTPFRPYDEIVHCVDESMEH